MRVLRSQRVVFSDGERPAQVVIEGERIARIAALDEPFPSQLVEDLGSYALLPGLVDCHVHVNEPGRTAWEGFATATRAAAAGGVTTIVDMPLNSIPATTTYAALQQKIDALGDQLTVDVGLWGGVVPGNRAELKPMIKAGALGFKCFLVDSGVDEFPAVDAAILKDALTELAITTAPILVHAELPGPIEAAAAAFAASGAADDEASRRAYARYLESRPPRAEDEAIALVSQLCDETRGRAHIVHLSAASALSTLLAHRERGLSQLTAETTPHYLVLEAEQIPDGATEYKCAPPIREHANREALWRGLGAGLVDFVVTDHSPCTPDLKRMEVGDFVGAWGGIASLQLGLRAVWTEASTRGHQLVDLVRWMAEQPARLASQTGRKGRIAVGYDADLVVFDPEHREVISAESIQHRHKVTPYLGRTLRGRIVATWLRGERIFAHGQAIARRGRRLDAASGAA